MPVRPYGTWPGAIGSDVVARAGRRSSAAVAVDGTRVRWAEARPAEAGRWVVVRRAAATARSPT